MAKKPYTLVVIDMQYYFGASLHCDNSVLSQIERANNDGMPVIFVEYKGCGPTWSDLLKAASTKYKVIKYDIDGSREVIKAIKKFKLPRNIKICGVEFDACVCDTACGIAENKEFSVNVIKSACATYDGDNIDNYTGIKRQLRSYKIKLVA